MPTSPIKADTRAACRHFEWSRPRSGTDASLPWDASRPWYDLAMSRPTAIPQPIATVVVVGGPKSLVDATRSAAQVAASAKVYTAELTDAANVVATCRPFAIVMSEDVYAFDAAEFDALARDVKAALVRIADPTLTQSKLERALMPKLGQAYRRPR